jgi:hypothetical protein
MRRVSTRGLFFAVPLLLLALSATAGTGSSVRAKPVKPKPRTLVIVNEFIRSFAQSGDAVAWIDSSDRVYVKRLSKTARSFVGSALGGGNRATLEYTPLLTLVGTRAFWTTYDGGNSVEIAIYVGAPGKKKSLIDVIGSDPDGSGTGGYFPSLVSDGPRLVYGFANVDVPGGGWPTDCSQLELGDKGVEAITGPPYDDKRSAFIPGVPAVMMLDASRERIAVVPAAWQVPPGERCAGLAVGENGPVDVYDLDGTLVSRVSPVGTVQEVAVDWPRLGVFVKRHNGTKAIQLYSAATGSLVSTTPVRSTASDLAMASGRTVYRVGTGIYQLRNAMPSLVWRAKAAPVGLSIEGRRIAWAVNPLRARSSIVALTLR